MDIQTKVDRFGRVVIPKGSRDHLGLAAGSSLTVTDIEGGVLLRPNPTTPAVRIRGGVLVFSGQLENGAEGMVSRSRDERIRRFLPGPKR